MVVSVWLVYKIEHETQIYNTTARQQNFGRREQQTQKQNKAKYAKYACIDGNASRLTQRLAFRALKTKRQSSWLPGKYFFVCATFQTLKETSSQLNPWLPSPCSVVIDFDAIRCTSGAHGAAKASIQHQKQSIPRTIEAHDNKNWCNPTTRQPTKKTKMREMWEGKHFQNIHLQKSNPTHFYLLSLSRLLLHLRDSNISPLTGRQYKDQASTFSLFLSFPKLLRAFCFGVLQILSDQFKSTSS